LQELMKNLQRRHEVHFAKDGMEALDFFHCRETYVDAPHPKLTVSGLRSQSLANYALCVIVRVEFREKPNLSARRIPSTAFVDFRTDL